MGTTRMTVRQGVSFPFNCLHISEKVAIELISGAIKMYL